MELCTDTALLGLITASSYYCSCIVPTLLHMLGVEDNSACLFPNKFLLLFLPGSYTIADLSIILLLDRHHRLGFKVNIHRPGTHNMANDRLGPTY
jgi:hypothetical protein